MPLIALAIVIVLAFIALIPFSLVQRFRMGTARRQARGWVATLNLVAIAISLALFLIGALIATQWIPGSFTYTLLGLAVGSMLGLVGTILTRWEYVGGRIQYHTKPLARARNNAGGDGARVLRFLARLGGVARECGEHDLGRRVRSRGVDVGRRCRSWLLLDFLDGCPPARQAISAQVISPSSRPAPLRGAQGSVGSLDLYSVIVAQPYSMPVASWWTGHLSVMQPAKLAFMERCEREFPLGRFRIYHIPLFVVSAPELVAEVHWSSATRTSSRRGCYAAPPVRCSGRAW